MESPQLGRSIATLLVVAGGLCHVLVQPNEWFGIALLATGLVSFCITHWLTVIHRSRAEERRRHELLLLSIQLGLDFNPGHDTYLTLRYGFIQKMLQGSNRYAFNVLAGEYRGHTVCGFDFHYETKSATRDEMQSHEVSVLILHVPADFPELLLARKNNIQFLSGTFGSDDIALDSHEFNRLFSVRAEDKKFAYDICHPRMMEFLLENPDLSLEYDLDVIALVSRRTLQPARLQFDLDRLVELRKLVPDYLLTPA